MEIIFNKKGTPLLFSSRNAFGSTTGSPEESAYEQKTANKTVDLSPDRDSLTVSGRKILAWRSSNDFPRWADKIITSTGVLNTGLKFIRNLTIGQGIYACRVDGYDDRGNEILKPYHDPDVNRILLSRKTRRYLEKVLRDYLKFGSAFVQFVPNVDGSRITGLNTVNAYFCRITEQDKNGFEQCCVSGKWPDMPGESDFLFYDALQEYDPETDLDIRKFEGKAKDSSMFILRDSWSNRDTYSEPVWMACYTAGWIDIAKSIPKYLRKVYKNQASWKWHVQIPYSFWEKKFPESEYEDVKDRESAVNVYMDEVEDNLLGAENAEKPIFTHYTVNDLNGKVEEEWKITPLDNKSKDGDKLVTSAAANSEILFSLMINPNVMGAGMPGGAYAGNQGGSNIREAFLVNVANAWIDRQNILDPLEIMLRYNGYADVELRFRNTILTTLDTGSGTSKTLS
ncbi:MAG: hypothetical protein LBL57_07765 [Tannerella sp.]|jgi:hypothetical protein|nr:hypothetical protein [Tannerella sp.]